MSNLFDSGIRPAVDQYLQKKTEELRDYEDYWSASSAGYCQRLVIMRRLGVPKVPELQEDQARTTRVFEVGHLFHEWLQRITKDAGLSIASEVELQDEDLMIRGHFDDLIYLPSTSAVRGPDEAVSNPPEPEVVGSIPTSAGHLILYDYKTANSQAFNYKKDEIGYYHKLQLGTYMYMLRKKGEFKPEGKSNAQSYLEAYPIKDLSEARILTLSKDDLRMREHQLLWSDELSREVNAYWVELNAYWNNKKLPPCTCLDHDGGFMGRRSSKGKVYNDYFYEDDPCSLKWYRLWEEKERLEINVI